ncbi:GNAT family N-acetyltransferase [Myxococcota bacterium]|nr:GNAT family N-acetyltransferase [Myxococcota bacterium]
MEPAVLRPVSDGGDRRAFFRLPRRVHRHHPQYRATEEGIVRMLCFGRTFFRTHAEVRPFLLRRGHEVVGRLALIRDRQAPDRVMVAFFECLEGEEGVQDAIREEARKAFPGARVLVAGLWGHMNYGAGFLCSRFEEPPIFGLPWNPPGTPGHWQGMREHPMVSYRFPNEPFYRFAREVREVFDPGPYRVRPLDLGRLERDTALYTDLNNRCFERHLFWTNRFVEEDYELFHPFRFLIRPENLLFVEEAGRAVGFLLWYPDFNQLAGPGRELGPWDVVRYRLRNPVRAVRLAEIGVLPEHRGGAATAALVLAMIEAVERGPYRFCEGGFIFQENQGSLGMTLKFISRAFGQPLEPYRRYAVFEGDL